MIPLDNKQLRVYDHSGSYIRLSPDELIANRLNYWKDIKDMMMVERFQISKIENIDVSRVEVEKFFSVYKDSIPIVPEKYSFSVIEIPFISGENKILLGSTRACVQKSIGYGVGVNFM